MKELFLFVLGQESPNPENWAPDIEFVIAHDEQAALALSKNSMIYPKTAFKVEFDKPKFLYGETEPDWPRTLD